MIEQDIMNCDLYAGKWNMPAEQMQFMRLYSLKSILQVLNDVTQMQKMNYKNSYRHTFFISFSSLSYTVSVCLCVMLYVHVWLNLLGN